MKHFFSVIAILGFMLVSCEDPCTSTVCLNGGVCSDGDCLCPEGFSGEECEREARFDFIGNYISNTDCMAYESYVRISRDDTKGTRVTIDNLLDTGVSVSGTVVNNQVTIQNQSWFDGTVEGFASSNNGLLTINVVFTDADGIQTNCLISGTKE